MANNCPVCLANIDIVGRVHRCVRVMEQKLPNVAVPDSSGPRTYKYRNADSRREYMANYMRGYRRKQKES